MQKICVRAKQAPDPERRPAPVRAYLQTPLGGFFELNSALVLRKEARGQIPTGRRQPAWPRRYDIPSLVQLKYGVCREATTGVGKIVSGLQQVKTRLYNRH